jgi:hypothetical protein
MRDQLDRQMAQMTRRSLLSGGAAALVGGGIWEWVRIRRIEDEIPWPLRTGLQIDEQLTRDYFRQTRLAPTFAANRSNRFRSTARLALRTNGALMLTPRHPVDTCRGIVPPHPSASR